MEELEFTDGKRRTGFYRYRNLLPNHQFSLFVLTDLRSVLLGGSYLGGGAGLVDGSGLVGGSRLFGGSGTIG